MVKMAAKFFKSSTKSSTFDRDRTLPKALQQCRALLF